MKSFLTKFAVGSTAAVALLSVSPTPAFAQDGAPRPGLRAGASTTVQARMEKKDAAVEARMEKKDAAMEARITKAKERAHQEITRRITAMQELSTRIQGMARVSDASKASISSTLQAQISNLTTLDAKIAADTDIDTIKTDIKSITSSYRIYMLVMPQGRILAAADRSKTVAANLTTFSGKLATRITEAQTAGKDVAALNSLLADMNAKIADITVQADAAIALVSGLTPDNGDKAKQEANKKALDEARAKIKTAQEDAKIARKTAGSIVDALKAFKLGAGATTTVAN